MSHCSSRPASRTQKVMASAGAGRGGREGGGALSHRQALQPCPLHAQKTEGSD